ncbi:hypothetical protein [Sulfitobacter aestuariivivens]|uniref:Uncharacterized protein n=1 Tax=Sulfitobacter aestuariivivens TaxID=2766981 RepID=A0A927D6I7_9RHOB|nr:hypothetical protein [Sulfitobacter aestuariivivens]MBD3664412.1 hypothetical protein [Sulfitobacter aestuariivivens]
MTANPKTEQPSPADDLDPNSLAAIRNLLAREDSAKVASPAVEPAIKNPEVETTEPAMDATGPDAVADDENRAPDAVDEPEADLENTVVALVARQPAPTEAAPKDVVHKVIADQKKAEGKIAGLVARLKSRITGYRPKPKHILITGSLLLVYFRPWLVLGLFFLLAFIFVGILLILGYDGFWRRTMAIARWHARRSPSRSAELHRRLDNFAMRFDAFLDRFPEGSVDGLYLPDFGDIAEAEARHDAALDRRLSGLRESDA